MEIDCAPFLSQIYRGVIYMVCKFGKYFEEQNRKEQRKENISRQRQIQNNSPMYEPPVATIPNEDV